MYFIYIIFCTLIGIAVYHNFFDQLFAVLSTLRNERDHATLMARVKRRVDIVDPVEIEYAEILTPYALQFVSKQLLLKSHVNFIGEVQSCFLVSSAGSIKVTNYQL